MTYQPYRYRLASVERFIPVLEQLLRKGGTPVSFDPADLHISVETALGRLRDAVHALSTGLVLHPNINPEHLRSVWHNFKATSDGTRVILVSRQAEQVTASPQPIPVTEVGRTQPLAQLRTTQPRFVETLTAFAVLLGQRILQGEVHISGELTDTLQERLTQENDIVFRKETVNTYVML